MKKFILTAICALAPLASSAGTICLNENVKIDIKEAGGKILAITVEGRDQNQFALRTANNGVQQVPHFNFNENVRQKNYRWIKKGQLGSFQGIGAWTQVSGQDLKLELSRDNDGIGARFTITDMALNPLHFKHQVTGGKLICAGSENELPNDHHLMTENEGDEK